MSVILYIHVTSSYKIGSTKYTGKGVKTGRKQPGKTELNLYFPPGSRYLYNIVMV